MSYMFSLSLLYIILGVGQLEKEAIAEQNVLCLALSYLTFYGVLSCFMWLIMMCRDILRSIGFLRLPSYQSHDNLIRLAIKREQKGSFMKYGLLSFGIPGIITATMVAIDFVIKPDNHQCSKLMVKFDEIDFAVVFLPIAVLTILGIFFYAKAAVEIFQMRRKPSRLAVSNMIRADHKLLSQVVDVQVENARLKLETSR